MNKVEEKIKAAIVKVGFDYAAGMLLPKIAGGLISQGGRFIVTKITRAKLSGKFDHADSFKFNFRCNITAVIGPDFKTEKEVRHVWKMSNSKGFKGQFIQ